MDTMKDEFNEKEFDQQMEQLFDDEYFEREDSNEKELEGFESYLQLRGY